MLHQESNKKVEEPALVAYGSLGLAFQIGERGGGGGKRSLRKRMRLYRINRRMESLGKNVGIKVYNQPFPS